MKTEVKKSVQTRVGDNNDTFNFEIWVREVKPQLLAALKKRSEK